MKRFILIIVSLFGFLLSTIPIYSSITNVSDNITTTITEPSNLSLGSYENSEHIYIFKEKQGYTLSDELQVDHLVTSDTNGWLSSSGDLISGTISSDTKINVYLIHFDPVGSTTGVRLKGSVTFSNNIIGLEVKKDELDNSDFLGFASTYPTTNLRGLELNGKQDYFSISDNQRTLSVNLYTDVSLDEIRIITATPIPSSILILSIGIIILFGVILLHRRKDTEGVNF